MEILNFKAVLNFISNILYKLGFKFFDKYEDSNKVIDALLAELHAIKGIIDKEITPKIFEQEDYFPYQYPNRTDYFSIYNANQEKIGCIKDKNLRECIVSIYVKSKYFLDCLITNGEILDDYDTGQHTLEEYKNLINYKQNCIIPTYNEILNLFNELAKLENKRG